MCVSAVILCSCSIVAVVFTFGLLYLKSRGRKAAGPETRATLMMCLIQWVKKCDSGFFMCTPSDCEDGSKYTVQTSQFYALQNLNRPLSRSVKGSWFIVSVWLHNDLEVIGVQVQVFRPFLRRGTPAVTRWGGRGPAEATFSRVKRKTWWSCLTVTCCLLFYCHNTEILWVISVGFECTFTFTL